MVVLASILASALLALAAGSATAGEVIPRGMRPVPVQEEEKPTAEPSARGSEAGRAPRPAVRALPAGRTKPDISVSPKIAPDLPSAEGPGSGAMPTPEINATLMQALRECAAGFHRAIVPDEPGGSYSCVVEASPACTDGYTHIWNEVLSKSEGRFVYRCSDSWIDAWCDGTGDEEACQSWKSKPQVCPGSWALQGPGGEYECWSSEWACKFDHEVGDGGFSYIGSDSGSSHIGGKYRYGYVCKFK